MKVITLVIRQGIPVGVLQKTNESKYHYKAILSIKNKFSLSSLRASYQKDSLG